MKKIILSTSVLFPLISFSQTKFIPTNGEIYIIRHLSNTNTNSNLYKYNIHTNTETLIGPVLDANNQNLDIRGIAMNPKDSFIYGVVYNTRRIVRIDANANSTDVTLTNPGQLSIDTYQSADCDTAGNLYLYKINGTTVPKINLINRTVSANIQTPSRSSEDFVVNRAGTRMYLKRQVLTEMSEYTLNVTGTNTENTIDIQHSANQSYLMFMDNLDNIYTINTSNYRVKALGMGTYDVVTDINTTNQQSIINGDAAYFRIPLYLEPIPCDEYLYQVIQEGKPNIPGSSVIKFNHFTNQREFIGSTGSYIINAAGYSKQTQLLYAYASTNNTFLAIGANAKYIAFKFLNNNPTTSLNTGDIDDNGHYYVRQSNASNVTTNYYCFNVNPNSTNYLQLVNPRNNFARINTVPTQNSTANADFAIHPTNFRQYGVYSANGKGYMNIYDPTTGIITTHELSGSLANSTSGFGGAFFDANANLFAFDNGSGIYHRININNYTSTRISNNGTSNNSNDGASCTSTPSFETDLGDAPTTYSTLLNDIGPLHIIDSRLMIGNTATHEEDGSPSTYANEDTDDAFSSTPNLSYQNNGYQITFPITNNTGTLATISGWIDFDGNGIFDANEKATITAANSGNVTLTWNTFTYVKKGDTYLRLRIALDANEILLPTGNASIGEVEDHIVNIINEPLPISFYSFQAVRISNDSAQLVWQFNNSENTIAHEIEYSNTGNDFSSIKIINEINDNQLLSNAPIYKGNNFFRIKVIERNGEISYSPIRKIAVEHSNSVIIKPNPAHDFILIDQKDFTYNTYTIYNQIGQKQLFGHLENTLNNQISIHDLQPGVYMIVLSNNFNTKTLSFIKN